MANRVAASTPLRSGSLAWTGHPPRTHARLSPCAAALALGVSGRAALADGISGVRMRLTLTPLFERVFQRVDRSPSFPASHPSYHRLHDIEDPEKPPISRVMDLSACLRGNQLVLRSRFHDGHPQPSQLLL